MSDTVVSGITLLAVFGTIVVVTVLAAQGSFHFGAGKGLTLLAMLMATAGEFLCTAWMRFLVNRRYFASVPSSAPAGGNFGGGLIRSSNRYNTAQTAAGFPRGGFSI